MSKPKRLSLFQGSILRQATIDSLRKLAPGHVIRNPVMFVVEIGSILTTIIWIRDLASPAPGHEPAWFTAAVTRCTR